MQTLDIYSAVDVFVNPMHQEVFGCVNLEVQVCGTMVITYNSGGAPETIQEGKGIIVPKGDIDRMIETIECIAKN